MDTPELSDTKEDRCIRCLGDASGLLRALAQILEERQLEDDPVWNLVHVALEKIEEARELIEPVVAP
jgi:hypothetical protein